MKTQPMREEFKPHFPKEVYEVEDDDSFLYGTILAIRKDKSGAIKVRFSEEDEPLYFYRRRIIRQNMETPTGYYGRWRMGGSKNGFWSDSLRACVEYIDRI